MTYPNLEHTPSAPRRDLADPIGPRDHVLGGGGTRVTLVEYGDYECPYCALADGVVGDVVDRLWGLVGYAFRHFPLTQAHPHSLLAAQAAEAAGAQGHYWPMHELLFASQDALERDDLIADARRLELDVDRFTEDLDRQIYLPRVRADIGSGNRSGVRGTPTFFLDGMRFRGRWDGPSLEQALRRAAEQAAGAR